MSTRMTIKKNLQNILSKTADHVTLVAVTKTKPVSDIMEAYEAGQRVFGENKIHPLYRVKFFQFARGHPSIKGTRR